MTSALRQLETLAAMIVDAELSRLNQLVREVEACNEELARLAEAGKEWACAVRSGMPQEDFAILRGQEALWSVWLTQQRTRVARQAVEAAARREEQRLRAKTALGRLEALGHIRKREDAASRRRSSRTK